MKQVGILTMHAAHNCGTALQAYALKTVITQLGYDCHLINFQSDVQRKQYAVFNTKHMNLKIFVRNLLQLVYVRSYERRRNLFFAFQNQYLDGASPILPDLEAVEKAAQEYDCLVVGSDQVWNLTLNDASKAYFLDFPKREKRIAYAASFGNGLPCFLARQTEFLPVLKKYDAISLREQEGVKYFRQQGIPSELVLDPTLLLDSSEWNCITVPPLFQKPYIFYYSLNCKPYSIKATQKISRILHLPVINATLHTRAVGSGFKKIIECGPPQFLSLIQNASFVCTDSFHGTAFSIIMKKPFVSIFDSKESSLIRDDRRACLLEQLGMEKRMVTLESDFDQVVREPINYQKIEQAFCGLRGKSLIFLKESLEDKRENA